MALVGVEYPITALGAYFPVRVLVTPNEPASVGST